MSWIQLVQPVPNVKGEVGGCLKYSRMFYGAPVGEYSAWEAWEATDYKHTDRNLPNVSVPVWFEHWGTYYDARIKANRYGNWGHVVGWYPGVGFYSSPWQTGTDHAVLKSIEDVERIYHCKFVGWSEDISNVRVAKEQGMNKEQAQQLSLYLRLLDFESVDEANKHSEDDVNHMLADPGYAAALAKQIYKGQRWQDANHKAVSYDKDTKAAYEKGKAEAGSNCTPEERAFLDGLYKITKGK